MAEFRVAIVGATGLVGQEMRKVFVESVPLRRYPLLLLASQARPAEGIAALADSWKELESCAYILNASDDKVAREIAAHLKAGQVLIDNSSAYRMDARVPLVVPEVNGAELKKNPQIIANPNCTAALLCMCLNVLKKWGLERVWVSTYQAASGAGIKGLNELEAQVAAASELKNLASTNTIPAHPAQISTEVFRYPLHMNVMSHNSSVLEDGFNDEESKVISESRRILGLPNLKISATCMRVPVRRAHTEVVGVDLAQDFNLDEIRSAFAGAPGLKVVDDRAKNHFPMPLEAENQDQVLVGRFRQDRDLSHTLHFILAGDQLRKGAATNAIQILRAIAQV